MRNTVWSSAFATMYYSTSTPKTYQIKITIQMAGFNHYRILLLAGCLALTFTLYFAGLNGGYYFDDTHVLKENPFIKIVDWNIYGLLQAANSFVAGGREISMLSFALNYLYFGESTWWLKFVNLCIHCMNGIGLYWLASQLVRLNKPAREFVTNSNFAYYFPVIVAALWLVHPINLIPVLYISQRMTLLSSLFVIYGLTSDNIRFWPTSALVINASSWPLDPIFLLKE